MKVLVGFMNSVQDPHKKMLPLGNARNALPKWRLKEKKLKRLQFLGD